MKGRNNHDMDLPEPSGQADPQGDDKKWQATRESFVSGDGSSG
jgi:hypothetical protein